MAEYLRQIMTCPLLVRAAISSRRAKSGSPPCDGCQSSRQTGHPQSAKPAIRMLRQSILVHRGMPPDREIRVNPKYFLGLGASLGKASHFGVARRQPDARHDVVRQAHDRLPVSHDGLVELPQQELGMRKRIEIPA